MDNPTPQATEIAVEAVAMAMAQEIGWGTFSHFDPNDMRRVARAAYNAARLQSTEQRLGQDADGGGVGELVERLRRTTVGYGPREYMLVNPDGPEAADDLMSLDRAVTEFAGTIREQNDVIAGLQAERDRLREALRPFADAFVAARDKYIRRYGSNPVIGATNFDAMPGDWKMDTVMFTMGDFRRADAELNPIKDDNMGGGE